MPRFAAGRASLRPRRRRSSTASSTRGCSTRSREQVTVAAQAAGWPVAPVLEPGEVLAADHLHQRGFWVHAVDPDLGPDAPSGRAVPADRGRLASCAEPHQRLGQSSCRLRRRATSRRAPRRSPRPTRPCRRSAGSACSTSPPCGRVRYLTALLGDLGAEVIRVESPRVFPPTTKGVRPPPRSQHGARHARARFYGPRAPGREDRPYNRHAMNNSVSRGKRSCTLDVRVPRQTRRCSCDSSRSATSSSRTSSRRRCTRWASTRTNC